MKKILLIEDEVVTVNKLIEKLKRGYDVEVVESGNSALESLNQNQYDLVVLDIMLPHGGGKGLPPSIPPKQSGIEILKKIRAGATRNLPKIPVVVLTAVSDIPDLREIRRYRPVNLFQKPKEFSVLYEAIVEAIEGQ